MNKTKILLVSLVLILAAAVRLYKVDNPVADWHSFRQADTASVTRHFVENGVNLLVPTYHDYSNIQSGKDNPNGYRMVEFPLYNLFHYFTYSALPQLGLDTTGRLTSVILSLSSIIFLFLIAQKLSGFFIGWLSALFMAVLPFNIFFSRVILPEPLMITLFLASFWWLLVSTDKTKYSKRVYFLLSAICLAGAILVKPYAIFFALPHAAIILRQLVLQRITTVDALAFAGISLLPFYLWRRHINFYPEGIPASDWLFNSSGIRFRPAWFRWLFAERLGKMILGIYGTSFFLLGLIAKPKNEGVTYWLWMLGILVYFSVVAGGNVRHDYYQAIIIPFICVILAKGAGLMLGLSRTTYSRWLTIFTGTGVFAIMIALSWYDIEPFYHINNPAIIEAGKEVDRLTPKDAKVIAPYNGDTAFLYQTGRNGWPLGYYIDDKIAKGATHYVSVVYDDEARDMERQYTVLAKTDKYIIVGLFK